MNDVLFWYKYYTYFILLIICLMTPLVIYIILTQSKTLKDFKWLILNNLFWCFISTFMLTVVKPVIISPAPGGFLLGLFRNESHRTTGIITMLIFSFAINTGASIAASLANRYSLVFPSILDKIFHYKALLVITLTGAAIFYGLMTIVMIPVLSVDKTQVLQWIQSFKVDEAFLQESSLLVFPPSVIDSIMLPLFVILCIFLISCFFYLFFFIRLVLQFKTKSVTALKKSLITSALAQIGSAIVFLNLPVTFMIGSIVLKIPYSASYSILACSMLCTGCVIEYFIILYFILPYRRFVQQHIGIIFKTKKIIKINTSTLNLA